jgi:hypothetical protein
MSRPRIVITAYGEAILTFPFNRGLVEALKREVPAYARSYEPATKAWTVNQPYIATAGALVEATFADVEVIDHSPSFSRPAPPTPRTEYHVLHLQPTAPPELVEAAYRTLTKLYHPDRGGDTETMAAINAAVSVIRGRVAP